MTRHPTDAILPLSITVWQVSDSHSEQTHETVESWWNDSTPRLTGACASVMRSWAKAFIVMITMQHCNRAKMRNAKKLKWYEKIEAFLQMLLLDFLSKRCEHLPSCYSRCEWLLGRPHFDLWSSIIECMMTAQTPSIVALDCSLYGRVL